MADINQTYGGVVESYDADVVIYRIPQGVILFGWPTGGYQDVFLPEPLRAEIRKLNTDSKASVDAVKVPYTGSTTGTRELWLNERIQAINSRAVFIKGRTDVLLNRLKSIGGEAYDTLSKVVTSALALVPVVGQITTYAQSQVTAGQTLERYQVQNTLQNYAADLQQLAVIRKSLIEELQALNPPNTSTDPTNSAANIRTDYLLYGALGLIVLLFIIYRIRNRR